MDFQYQRGHKKPRTENRRRSLFRTPPKLREQAGESNHAVADAPAQLLVDPMAALPNTASSFDVGSVGSEVLGKRQYSESNGTSDGGLRSSALPDETRLSKAIGEAVESGLTRARSTVKPGEGFALDAADRVAQCFATESEELILRNFSQNTLNPAERNLQQEAKKLNQYLVTMMQEAEDWKRILEQVELDMEHPASDETTILSASVQASTSTDGALSTRLPQAVGAAAERISLQLDTMQRAVQHAKDVAEGSAKIHANAIERVQSRSFGGISTDARPLLRKLAAVGAARADKENLG